jgi:hypothetical protein
LWLHDWFGQLAGIDWNGRRLGRRDFGVDNDFRLNRWFDNGFGCGRYVHDGRCLYNWLCDQV